MEVEIDMNTMLLAKLNDTIDLFEWCFVDVGPVLWASPDPVGEWNAREVKAPFLHRCKIEFLEGGLGVVVVMSFPLQIEAAPMRDGLDLCAKRIVRGYDLGEPIFCVADKTRCSYTA